MSTESRLSYGMSSIAIEGSHSWTWITPSWREMKIWNFTIYIPFQSTDG